jgi:hypothetical protein
MKLSKARHKLSQLPASPLGAVWAFAPPASLCCLSRSVSGRMPMQLYHPSRGRRRPHGLAGRSRAHAISSTLRQACGGASHLLGCASRTGGRDGRSVPASGGDDGRSFGRSLRRYSRLSPRQSRPRFALGKAGSSTRSPIRNVAAGAGSWIIRPNSCGSCCTGDSIVCPDASARCSSRSSRCPETALATARPRGISHSTPPPPPIPAPPPLGEGR